MDFNFRYLAGQSVEFCKGITARVLSASTISADIEGGCCGNRMILDANKSLGAFLGNLVPINVLKGNIAAFPARNFQPGRNLLQAVDPEIALSEQLEPDKAEMIPCIKKFDLSNVSMDPTNGVQADVEVAYEIFLSFRGRRPGILVRELAGKTHVRGAFSNYLYIHYDNGRPEALVPQLMKSLNSQPGDFMKPVYNAEAAKNLELVSSQVDSSIYQKQLSLVGILKYVERSERIESFRQDLYMLGSVGLNHSARVVDTFLRRVQDMRYLPSVTELVDRVVMKGHPAEVELERVDQARSTFAAIMEEMAKSKNLVPDTAPLDARLIELKMLKEMRTRLTRKAATDATFRSVQ
jgi:hypothetical protein